MKNVFQMLKIHLPQGRLERKARRKTIAEYQQEMLNRVGREQFKKLTEKGLGIPVGLL